MNKKAVRSALAKKFNEFTQSIEDASLRENVKQNTIITGGAIASMLLGEEIKDYDLYFTNKETAVRVAHYYTTKFNNEHKSEAYVQIGTDQGNQTYLNGSLVTSFSKPKGYGSKELPVDRLRIFISSAGVAGEAPLEEPFEDVYDKLDVETKQKPKFRPVFLSSNAITLSDKIQLIIRFYGNAEDLHKNFDFVHATNYFETINSNLVLRQEATENLLSKELKYVGSRYPLCSIIRTRKFINRGYKINAGQYLKMMYQVSQLDLNDIDVLEEQLIGVDTAYFTMMIDSLRLKKEKDPNFSIDQSYISEIIDKLF